MIKSHFPISFKVPENVSMTDSLHEKLERLNIVHTRVQKIRNQLQILEDNISAFTEMEVTPGSDEHLFYLAKMSRFEDTSQLIWNLQDEIRDLQSEVLQEIYGQGIPGH